jgi:4,5-dihydroxyphthalate decarboxylase
MCHVDAGINGPEDLAGKRVGVGEYQQTAAVWSRGIFEHDFGVSQYDIEWFMERAPEQSHGAATGFRPPEGIKFHQVPSDRSLATMLVNHELDAASVKRALRKPSNLVERSTRMKVSPDQFKKVTKPVFADPITEGGRFFSVHGFIPINHTYVIRGELLRKHPWVAINVFKAMIEAKKLAESRLIDSIPLSLVFKEEYMDRTQELLGDDPFPYGLEQNRNVLQTLIDYSYEQGLTTAKANLDSLFDEEAVAYAAMIGL